MPEANDIYRDAEGRQFRLVARTDPQGPVPAYWSVIHTGTGRKTTIREDRLAARYERLT